MLPNIYDSLNVREDNAKLLQTKQKAMHTIAKEHKVISVPDEIFCF